MGGIHCQTPPDLRRVLREPAHQNGNGNGFADPRINQRLGWENLLTPHLRTVLATSGSFTDEQIHQHCRFFDLHIVPFLGSSPKVVSPDGNLERTGPVSRLTKDGTPLEFSMVWKQSSKGSTPGVRYVVDIAAQDSGSIRALSLERALAALDKFDALAQSPQEPLDVVTFRDIWHAVTREMLDFDRAKHCGMPCSRCSASGMYLGFELRNSTVMLKPYWLLPTCASTEELLQLTDDVIKSCAPWDDFYRSEKFRTELARVKKHILTDDPASRLHPCLLSIDATKAPAQRFKLYTRCIFQTSPGFEAWAHHLHASGAVTIDPDFIKTFGGLWDQLRAPESEWLREERQAQPNFAWVQFEFTPIAATQSKIYIMCPEIPRPDNYIARSMLDQCPLLDQAEFIKSLASTRAPTDFSTVIAVKPGAPVAEVTLYFTPGIFARKDWSSRFRSNGYFTKVRNRSYANRTK